MDKIVKPIDRLRGEIDLPGDKSISHRVALFGGISLGATKGKNFLKADDCLRTLSAFKEMGVDAAFDGKNVTIEGRGLKGLKKPGKELYLGNSGTTMRILPGILAGQDFEATLTGDDSLTKRPMGRIIEPLRKMGVDIKSKGNDGFPPLVIRGGRVTALEYETKVASAQVKSCILLAGLYADGKTMVTEPFLSRDHTERMLDLFGAKIFRKGLSVSLGGSPSLKGQEFFVPGDISSAAFFIGGAAILEGSDVLVRDAGLNPTRIGFINVLRRMGADITVTVKNETVEPYGDIRVRFAPLKAVVIEKGEIPLLIDEIPILAVIASRARGKTVIKGAGELRVKETDRIFSMTENLRLMGSKISSEKENLIITGGRGRFEKAALKSFGDHRTAMSMAIACLFAKAACKIEDTDCITTSFPAFFEVLDYLG
ncbi:MAG: 3-phosphoshikimate 1-carboxyvinyltransferase [Candidatus Omnitrophica bacterium]|nr:3-phosphoshikimate 1-carboxyvinyltransferase [Candidatus Omnitrophota bacterium]